MLLQPCNLVGIALQPRPHVVGHLVGAERAVVGVAEHGRRAVVAADNYKTVFLAHVEHIVECILLRILHQLHLAMRQLHTTRTARALFVFSVDKRLCLLCGLVFCHGACHHRHRYEKRQKK